MILKLINRFFLFSLLCSCFAVVLAETINGVAAVVGDDIVLKSDIDRELMSFAYQNQVDVFSSPQEYEKHFNLIRQELILRKVALLHAYKDTNIVVSNNEIERSLSAQIELMINQVGSQQALEQELNKSLREIKAEYWDMIKDMLFFDRLKYLKTQSVYVNREEVVSFFNSNRSLFSDVEDRFDFSLFELKKEASFSTEVRIKTFLSSIRDSILNNSFSFEEMAKKYSEDPGTARLGGDLGFTKRGSLVQSFEEVAYNLQEGDVSEPFKSVFGYHLVLLVERVGEKIKTKHILKTIKPSKQDIVNSSLFVDSIYSKHANSLDGFNVFLESNKEVSSLSGVYKKQLIEIFPDVLKTSFDVYSDNHNYKKLEDNNSFFILRIINKYDKESATIINSWNKIEKAVLYNKKEKVFNNWIKKLKKNTYVEIY